MTIPESVKSIEYKAFAECTGLTSVTIPEGVTSIEWSTFFNCKNLSSITIPESVTNIKDDAFSNCGLNEICSANFIAPDVTSSAFNGLNKNNCTLYVPAGSKQSYVDKWEWPEDMVAEVDYGYFVVDGIFYKKNEDAVSVSVTYSYGSNYSGDIVIPETVTYNGTVYTVTNIGSEAFYQCTDITSVIIPASVKSIEYNTFAECTGLKSLTIKEGVTSIGERAFYNCSGLTSVIIPESVTFINFDAFCGCSNLKTVSLSQNLETLHGGSFRNCRSLESVILPEGLDSINGWTFNGCSGMTEVILPSTIEFIGGNAFEGCTGLQKITCNAITPPELSNMNYQWADRLPFYGLNKNNCTLYVPAGSKQSYVDKWEWPEDMVIEDINVGISDVQKGEQKVIGIYTLTGIKVDNVRSGGTYIFIYSDGKKVKQYVR